MAWQIFLKCAGQLFCRLNLNLGLTDVFSWLDWVFYFWQKHLWYYGIVYILYIISGSAWFLKPFRGFSPGLISGTENLNVKTSYLYSMLSHVWLSATPWTVDHEAFMCVGFSRLEYWSRLPLPPPGDLPDPRIEPMSPTFPALASRFFTTEPPGKPSKVLGTILVVCVHGHYISVKYTYVIYFSHNPLILPSLSASLSPSSPFILHRMVMERPYDF